MTDIIKATPEDAGCYVDGHWGQYGTAHMARPPRTFKEFLKIFQEYTKD